MQIKKRLIANRLYGLGAAVGGAAGYLYWKYVGCLSGTCSIASKPWNSIIYFALMGSLLFSLFKTTKGKVEHD